jgi:hypothetical protein
MLPGMAAAGGAESVGVHYRRTGHQDFYTGGSGTQLWCTVCDALVIHAATSTPAQSAATKGWGADRATATRTPGEVTRGVDSFDPAPPIPVRHPMDTERPPANFDG